jgi:hypothetical protein
MSKNVRQSLHSAVDRLPKERLEDVLRFLELMANNPDLDAEDAWYLASGAFRFVNDDTEEIYVPVHR